MLTRLEPADLDYIFETGILNADDMTIDADSTSLAAMFSGMTMDDLKTKAGGLVKNVGVLKKILRLGKEIGVAATKTFTAQMFILAQLCAEMSQNKELKEQLENVWERAADLLKYAPAAMEAKVQRYRYLTNAFILGRGLEYPIALEGALKILETNRIKMKGAPESDFYHGPIAQVKDGDLAIVISGNGPTYDDDISMIEKLHGLGAEVFVITNDEELYKSEKFGILTPDTGLYTAPFMFAICVQLFAYGLTVVRGIDPNRSEVLNKITITK